MKYVKYLLGILAILMIGFFLLGLIKPEVEYNCEIMADKPLEEAWAVAQDEEKMSEWLEGFQRVEHLSGTPGTVGAVANVYFITDGQEMVIKETITALEPNNSISMKFESDFMNMDYQLNMDAVDGQTKISSSTTAVGNNLFAKSLMAMMSGSIKAQEETNLANLKKTIENNTKDYFPEPEEMNDETSAEIEVEENQDQ